MPIPTAPQPTKIFFDPFNSSSTGHQRAENRLSGSTKWRDSRSYKLSHQLGDTSGQGGAKHLSDLVGAGSETYGKDGLKENGDWEVGAPGLREKGWQDIRDLFQGSRKRSHSDSQSGMLQQKKVKQQSAKHETSEKDQKKVTQQSVKYETFEKDKVEWEESTETAPGSTCPQIFRGLTIYLNGSTAPLVSDLRLKQMFVQHGGNASLALGRRTVTHVILGTTCGGGLASGKIQKENKTVAGKSIKYVTAKWVLDSVEKGIRQAESKYAPPQLVRRIGGSGQTGADALMVKH